MINWIEGMEDDAWLEILTKVIILVGEKIIGLGRTS